MNRNKNEDGTYVTKDKNEKKKRKPETISASVIITF